MCGNIVERRSLRILSSESPGTLRKLCVIRSLNSTGKMVTCWRHNKIKFGVLQLVHKYTEMQILGESIIPACFVYKSNTISVHGFSPLFKNSERLVPEDEQQRRLCGLWCCRRYPRKCMQFHAIWKFRSFKLKQETKMLKIK